MTEVSRVLYAIEGGDPQAAAQLLPLVYDELRKLAASLMASEKPGQTLDATALVHEAYLRLIGSISPSDSSSEKLQFANRRHFFAAAAEAMRRILIDNARRKLTIKHGGARNRIPLDEAQWMTDSPEGLLSLNDALDQFAIKEPAKAELVRLRIFAGLSMRETAAVLGISVPTAERWWSFARTWLFADLAGQTNSTCP